MDTIVQTKYLLPGYVVSNGEITGNEWSLPNNILYVDQKLTESDNNQGSSSDMVIGGFNPNLPQDAVITGIKMKLIAKAGSITVPATTLTIYAVDNTSGQDELYPYIEPIELSLDLESYILGSENYLFEQGSLTPDQINNLKLALVANGDIYVDSILMDIYYYIPETPSPEPEPTSGCANCNSPIQVPEMSLQLPFLIGETEFYLVPGSMQYADGTPVQPGDVGDCGGTIDFVFDKGQIKTNQDDNFEENVTLDLSSGYWEVLTSGVVKVVIESVNNRGLLPHTPYTHVSSLMSNHNAGSPVVISNNGKFYSRFQRKCAMPTNVYNELVSGSGTTFTLANVPNVGTVCLYANRMRLYPTIDYTIEDDVITTIESYNEGDLLADYNYQA